jgi:hypothetical protein
VSGRSRAVRETHEARVLLAGVDGAGALVLLKVGGAAQAMRGASRRARDAGVVVLGAVVLVCVLLA